MDGYVVGNVADLISNKKLDKIQQEKRKFQLSKITNVDHYSKNTFSKIHNESKNSLRFSFPDKCSLKNLSSEKKNLSQIAENIDRPIQRETSTKKKKSFEDCIPNSSDYEQDNCEDRNNVLLSLDNIPSDSEEEGEDLKKNFNKKRNMVIKNETSLKENKENTIFVGNIPINYNKQKVCKVFSKFGEIQNARIRCVPVENINLNKRVAAIKKQFNPRHKSLVAFVKYKSQDSVTAALKANGMIIDGHHIRVDLAEQIKERDNNKAVFVGGLPFDIEDDELWEFFQNCGEINSVRIIRDSQTSIGKGFGYVNFNSIASVELALQLNGQTLKKRTINVKRCVKSRNKNKFNAFGKKKSKEITDQLLCKKGKKFKEEKKKFKKKENASLSDFQGKVASMKQKKKKKLGKAALRQRKLIKILGAS